MSSYKDPLELDGSDDEEDLTDDEVFTGSGRPGDAFEENGVNKPLMAPRNKSRKNGDDLLRTKVRKVPAFRVVWGPLMYALIALGAILGIIALVVLVINTFMDRLRYGESPLRRHQGQSAGIGDSPTKNYQPLNNITVEEVWARTFPTLTTESALRMLDVNKDGIDDLVTGFGTGADAFSYPLIVCQVYFAGVRECGGGLLALDGKTGQELWRRYTAHEIFGLNCNEDLDGDSVKDCIGGGRMAGLLAVSGVDGRVIWKFNEENVIVKTSNFYTALYVRDVDLDQIPDVVVVHGGDPTKEPGSLNRLIGRIIVVSARTGRVIKWVQVPDKRESYYSPQRLVHPDGSELILFGTGGETHGGSLWCISLFDLLMGHIQKAKAIYKDSFKGVMTPPVLVDITGDGVSDIVMAMFNSTVFAFNGLTFEQLWYTKFPSSETYSTPGVGYYNNDSIPDFIVNYQTGPGFPIYYYTQTTVLDGASGEPLMEQPVRMVVGTQSSPLVISAEGYGNDVFLYWVADCHGDYADKELEFDFLQGTTVHALSRSDFCKLRFKEKLFTRMYAMTRHTRVPGTVVYDSDFKKEQEFGKQLNYTSIGLGFLEKHPEYLPSYKYYVQRTRPAEEDAFLKQDSPGPSQSYSDGERQKPRRPSYNDDDLVRGGTSRYPINAESRYPSSNRDRQGGDLNDGYFGGTRRIPPPEDYGYNDDDRYYGSDSIREPEASNSWMSPDVMGSSSRRSRRPVDGRRGRTNTWNKVNKRDISEQGLSSVINVTDNGLTSGQLTERPRGSRKVSKRHVGSHDGGGIQRTISTGALAPSFGKAANSPDSVDVLYATFWFYPANTQLLFPEDQRCIAERTRDQRERFEKGPYEGLDNDAFEEAVTVECLKKSGHYSEETFGEMPRYNPFDRRMGQMTVYRSRLTRACDQSHSDSKTVCPSFLPFQRQGWTAYLGNKGDCLFSPKPSSGLDKN